MRTVMKKVPAFVALSSIVLPVLLLAQCVVPRMGRFPESWPTNYGDYAGRRYSPLNQINASNVKQLSLAWTHRATAAQDGDNVGGEYKAGDPYYWGGPQANVTIKATPL